MEAPAWGWHLPGAERLRSRDILGACRERSSRRGERHLYVAPSARLDHLQLRGSDRFLILHDDKSNDVGVFVGTDGTSVLLGSPAGKNVFVKDTAEIWEYIMNFRCGESWDFSLNPPTKVTGSVLESVVPRWFW